MLSSKCHISASSFTGEDLKRNYGWLPGLDLRVAIPYDFGPHLILGGSYEYRRGDPAYEDGTFDLDGEASLSRALILFGLQYQQMMSSVDRLGLAILVSMGSVVERSPTLAWQYTPRERELHAHYGLRIEANPAWDIKSGDYELGLVAFLGKGLNLDDLTMAETASNLYFGCRVELGRQLGGE